jgi:hypothetical protein
VTVKDLETGAQERVPLSQAVAHIREKLARKDVQ